LAGIPQKEGKVYKRGPKPPPFLWEKGVPANFKIPKILTEKSFGIGMVNTEKIPKGSYRNTESVYNSNLGTVFGTVFGIVLGALQLLLEQETRMTGKKNVVE
jgi:hypothetical protein